MTVAEIVSELLYAGKTRAEIAGYDDIFMQWVLCKPRDEYGSLLRHPKDLPWWVTTDSKGQWVIKNPEPYSVVFGEVLKQRGLDDRQRRRAWAEWQLDNPGFNLGGE